MSLVISGLTIGCLAILTWSQARLRAMMAQAKLDKDALIKVQSDLASAQTQLDIVGRDTAMCKASMRSSAQAARQLATELERGMR